MIAADLFGQAADYDVLAPLAVERGLLLIDDAAQSFGGASGGRPVGSLAPVTTTSFYPAKPLGAYGDGGALFTDDLARAARWRSVRQHGQGEAKYDIVRVGLNSRLDTLQAAILLVKLAAFDAEIDARERVADDSTIRCSTSAVGLPGRLPERRSTWAQYTIRLERRDEVQAALAAQGDSDRDPLPGADAPATRLSCLRRGPRLAAGERASEPASAEPADARGPRRGDGHAHRPCGAGRSNRVTTHPRVP